MNTGVCPNTMKWPRMVIIQRMAPFFPTYGDVFGRTRVNTSGCAQFRVLACFVRSWSGRVHPKRSHLPLYSPLKIAMTTRPRNRMIQLWHGY